jgi:hypothetical protein
MSKLIKNNKKKKSVQQIIDSSDSDSSDSDSSDSDSSDSDSSDSDSSDSDSSDSDSSDSDSSDNSELIKTTKKRYNKIINIADNDVKFEKLLKLKYFVDEKTCLSEIEDKIDENILSSIQLKSETFNDEYNHIKQIDNSYDRIRSFDKLVFLVLDLNQMLQNYNFRTDMLMLHISFGNDKTKMSKKDLKKYEILSKKEKELLDYNDKLVGKINIKLKICYKTRFKELKSEPKLRKYLSEMCEMKSYLSDFYFFKDAVAEIDDYIEKNHHKYKKE